MGRDRRRHRDRRAGPDVGPVEPADDGLRRELLREGGVHLRRRLRRGLHDRVAERAPVPRTGMGRGFVRPSAAREVDDRPRHQGVRDGPVRVADRLGDRGHARRDGARPDRTAPVRPRALDVRRRAPARPREPERRPVAAGAAGRPRAALDRGRLPVPGPGSPMDRRADAAGASGGRASRPVAPVASVAIRGGDRVRRRRRREVVRRPRDARRDRDLADLGDVAAPPRRRHPRWRVRSGAVPGELRPPRGLRAHPVRRLRGRLPAVAAPLRLEGRRPDRSADPGGAGTTWST